MRDAIPCQVCGMMIQAHWELLGLHLHQRPLADELRSMEWQAKKKLNHLRNKVEKLQRSDRWRPPQRIRVQQAFKRYR
jgi:hypothetical protein